MIFAFDVLSPEVMVTALAGAVCTLAALIYQNMRSQLAEAKDEAKNYKSLASQAIATSTIAAKDKADAEGRTLPPVIADVVARANSPVSLKSLETADFQTLLAALVASKFALGQPALTSEASDEPSVET